MEKQKRIKLLKETYQKGMRVKLINMNDFQAPPIGTQGTVLGVDDIGSVMVAWDTGARLNVILEVDEIEILYNESNF